VKFRFILAHRGSFRVARMCEALEVSRSGFYAWCRRGPSERDQANQELAEEICEIHRANRRAYGSPRIYRELRSRGHHCGRHRVAQIMRLEGIRGCSKQRFYRTATVRAERKAAPDLLAREFAVEAANRVWVGDITQIRTREGWLFLAVILDLYSERSSAMQPRTGLAPSWPWTHFIWLTQQEGPSPDSSITQIEARSTAAINIKTSSRDTRCVAA